jgi:pyruvate formate lyase activating enzyme
MGIRSVAVTAGYICPEPRAELFRHMDATNIDLKGFTEDFYRRVCGAELGAVLDTLRYVRHETNTWLEVTTLLIPGLNDSDSELHALCGWFADNLGAEVPLHFTAFHPDWKLRDVPPTPLATLQRARRIALGQGLRYVYTGNVRDAEGSSTWCPHCRAQLIGRDAYTLTHWGLTPDGRCELCDAVCAGIFDGPRSDWGARRAPVRLSVLT